MSSHPLAPYNPLALGVLSPRFARYVSVVLLLFFALLVSFNLFSSFSRTSVYLAHDEAEHLHVVFALLRGERPYLDFIENHPVLLHLLLSKSPIPGWFPQTIDLYLLIKLIIGSCCIVTFLLFAWFARGLLPQGRSKSYRCLLVLIAVASLGAWYDGSIEGWGNKMLWELRPDWVCYLFAILCVGLHYEACKVHCDELLPRPTILKVLLAGACGGVATAILAKSVFIFAPYALTIVFVWFSDIKHWVGVWKNSWRRVLLLNLMFLGVGILTFSGLVAFELESISVPWDVYYKANFEFNATKHILFNANDFNPISILRGLTGLRLAWFVGLFGLVFLLLLAAYRHRMRTRFSHLCFLCLIVMLNGVIPAFSNGQTWPQYFIPSILALMLLYVFLYDQFFVMLGRIQDCLLSRLVAQKHSNAIVYVRFGMLLIFGGLALVQLSHLANAAMERRVNDAFLRQLYEMKTGDASLEFFPDRYFPSDLSYLVFSPAGKPVKARAWGYYFMLFPDQGAFMDLQKLGLSPNLGQHWRELYRSAPPDVIVVANQRVFFDRALLTYWASNGDVLWLWDKVVSDYVCVTHKTTSLFVRRNLLPRFQRNAWTECEPSGNEVLHGKGRKHYWPI